MKRTAFNWLGRRIALAGPYLTLCFSDAEFAAACAHLKVIPTCEWIGSPQADATAHHFTAPGGDLAAVELARALRPVAVALAVDGAVAHERPAARLDQRLDVLADD